MTKVPVCCAGKNMKCVQMIITGIARRFLRMTAIAGYSGVTDMPGFRLTALPVSPSVTLWYPTGIIAVRDATAPASSYALQSDDRFSAVSSDPNELWK